MTYSVTLLGSSSGRNAGDAALIAGIMDSIDAKMQQRVLYEIPTINFKFILHTYENKVHPISMMPWSGSVKMFGVPTAVSMARSDLSLIFDAILFDRAWYNPLFNYLSTLAVFIPVARRMGKKFGCYNVGVGPIQTDMGAKMLRTVLGAMDFITVRDIDSAKLLKKCGVPTDKVIVTADAALNLIASSAERAAEIIQAAGLDPAHQILGLNLSKYLDTWAEKSGGSIGQDTFLDLFADAVVKSLPTIGNPQVLLICTQHHDVAVSEALRKRIAVKSTAKTALVSNIECTPFEIKAILGSVTMLVGMRLHATILATSALTPTIAIPHQPKVTHYFRVLEQEEQVLQFDSLTSESLQAHIEKSWSNRAELRARLEKVVPSLKERAHVGAVITERVLKKQSNIFEGLDGYRPAI